MTRSIGSPQTDCRARREQSDQRRAALAPLSSSRGRGATIANGEETAYGMGFAANYHKGLPHDVLGNVHAPSYRDFVRALSAQDAGATETLPLGSNRAGSGASAEDPVRYSGTTPAQAFGHRKLTSPFTGYVFDTQGADAAAFAIAPAPRLDSDEMAAEMAELYAMALLRDVPFTAIQDGTGDGVDEIVAELGAMPWFQGPVAGAHYSAAERRRLSTRGVLQGPGDLFRGSTPGSKAGPWLSQFMLAGNRNAGSTFQRPNGSPGAVNDGSEPSFRGTLSSLSHEDGFVLFGTQVIDQRSIVAREGIDYMTQWASWLDAQNGVDFNNLDIFRDRRRYLTTPRDIATYVHYDALYQAYLVACLLMLAEGGSFPKDPGMPETRSRTRSAFASFGGPHVLSLVTEVATRALKAVWRQKWLHHRRARPEVVAAWLTLHENAPQSITDTSLRTAIANLRGKLPDGLLARIAAHNQAQNAGARVQPRSDLPADAPALPDIDPDRNFLLPMAFPEGSPTHPAYGAGHATVAGACVTVLKAFFDMFEADGWTPRAWPLQAYVPSFTTGGGGNANEGGELLPTAGDGLTIQGELDKLAMNIANARNMAGVHYYTDYYESLRLGERIAVSILEEQLAMYGEPVAMSFTTFDGEHLELGSNGDTAGLRVVGADGAAIGPGDWYARGEH